MQLFHRFTGYHPNTYTFSKSLAEQVVYEARKEIPAVIFRPSIGEEKKNVSRTLTLRLYS